MVRVCAAESLFLLNREFCQVVNVDLRDCKEYGHFGPETVENLRIKQVYLCVHVQTSAEGSVVTSILTPETVIQKDFHMNGGVYVYAGVTVVTVSTRKVGQPKW